MNGRLAKHARKPQIRLPKTLPAKDLRRAQQVARQTAAPEKDALVWKLVWFGLAVLLLLLLGTRLRYFYFPHDHYVYLAQNLTQGKLTVDNLPDTYPDIIAWQGHKYLPFGPLPALVLIPFLPLLNAGLDLGWFNILAAIFNIWLLSRILRLMNIAGMSRKWLMILFFGGTDYLVATLVPFSTWFAQVLVVTCTLLAIHEILRKRRPALIGLYVGLGLMIRLTSAFTLPFFIWMLWPERDEAAKAARVGTQLVRMAAGLACPLVLLLLYNYLRFGNVLETGYQLAYLGSPVLEAARARGLFSLIHIPKNLFVMLIQGPLPYPSIDAPVLQFPYLMPSAWGMGIFFTSPALLLAFHASLRERVTQACWLAIVFVLAPLVTYYGIGWVQFGYRYALDFMPFLFLLAVRGMGTTVNRWAHALIIASVLINIWGSVFFLNLR